MDNRYLQKSVRKERKKSAQSTGLNLSNSDLSATTTVNSRFNSGFPPGITVDELFHYRKKKPPAFVQLQDNLKPEEGSFRAIKSEYTKRFNDDIYERNPDEFRGKPKVPEDSLKVEGAIELKPEYYETFIEYPLEKSIVRRPKDLINEIGMEVENDEEEEKRDADEEDERQKQTETNTENYPHFPLGRHYLFKRPTNLKLEGDFYAETENAEKFIEYLLSSRPDLARTPTTLKMEGKMETKTENRDKYVPFEYQTRPPLYKKSTNLHLEGTLDITTENREKFLPYEPTPRAPLKKRPTNLHLEGDLKLQPEYRDAFVEHKPERSHPKLPVDHLKPEGLIETKSEKSEKFVEHQMHPVIPFLRGIDSGKKINLGDDTAVRRPEYREKFVEHPRTERFVPLRPRGSLKPEGDIETFTENKAQFVQKPVSKTETRKASNNLMLEGNIDMNPEYRNAYVNFYRDAYGKFGVKKDENEPERRRRRTGVTNLKTEGKLEANPEYRSAFVDFPRQRPSVKKPEGHLRSEGNLSHVTEKRAQFVEHPKTCKARPLKRQTELKLEGPLECQPEYRRAYIDYITREQPERQRRPTDNTTQLTQRVFDDGPPVPQMEIIPPTIEPLKPENAAGAATGQTEGSTALPEAAKSKLPLPAVSLKSVKTTKKQSNVPASRASGRKVNKENIAKMENCLFGPKIPNPCTTSKRLSDSERQRIARARRRYGSPVVVENLAYTPRASPVQAILEASNRGRWKRDDESPENQAFVVLGGAKEDCNNNDGFEECGRRSRVAYNELLKEQKWMPSWYAPSSK